MGVNLRDLLIFITLSDELTTGYAGLLILPTLLLFELTELQQRITTFRHWTLFYRNRKKLKNKSIHLDLTKSRLSLLNEARKLIENNEDIAFCYADINCRCKLQFKNNDDFFFESLDVLKSKLSGYSNNSNEWICVANGYCFDFKVCFS